MGTIDLNDLSVFAAVVETGSFSGAATRLELPKSSVSRAISRLEEGVRAALLHRTTRRVSLSATGRVLYEKVNAEVATLRRAVGEVPAPNGTPSGRIRVTSVADMGDFFADVVARFVARYPQTEVDLRLTNDNVDLVAQGIDLALRFSTVRLKDSSLNAKKLCAVGVELFASPAYLARKGTPRTPRDLENHEWVVYRRKTKLKLQKGKQAVSVETSGRITCDDFTFLRAALVSGCGIGYLGGYQAKADLTAGRLVRVLPDWTSPISNLWAIWPGPHKLSSNAAAFVDIVREAIRHELPD
jgi:DNA-binding transcriptional LysR family regulator